MLLSFSPVISNVLSPSKEIPLASILLVRVQKSQRQPRYLKTSGRIKWRHSAFQQNTDACVLVSDVSCQASHMSSLSCWEDEGMMAVRQPDDAAAKEITIWGGVPAFVSEILLGTFSICVCSNKTAHFFWWDIGSIIKFQHMVCRKVHCRQLFWGMGSKRAGHDTAVGDKEDMVLFHFWVNWTFKTRVYLLF